MSYSRHTMNDGTHTQRLSEVCFGHLKEGSCSIVQPNQDHEKVMAQADGMHLVDLSNPYQKQARLVKPFSEEEYRIEQEESILRVQYHRIGAIGLHVAAFNKADTLFLAACESFLRLSHAEYWCLPPAVWYRHPFRVALGHLKSGEQLRPEWTNPFPTRLSERNMNLNSLLFETCSSNYAKNNTSNERLERLQEAILSVSLSVSIYDPNMLLQLGAFKT
ncbi:hypothetical protein BDZ45DRAFT_803154 [Acephala macrosclerotiorum]|nr:hypothetical protein BDZ45DRAFT_803154 [Acephala macrosclerotiorum]